MFKLLTAAAIAGGSFVATQTQQQIQTGDSFSSMIVAHADLGEGTVKEHNLIKNEIINNQIQNVFTPADPQIVQDPFGNSPLSAAMTFKTTVPTQITVEIRTNQSDEHNKVAYTVTGFNTDHDLQIVGMYEGQINDVVITLEEQGGHTYEETHQITTGSLPADAP